MVDDEIDVCDDYCYSLLPSALGFHFILHSQKLSIIMLDVSFGEVMILTGVSIAVIGRKDLPLASKFLGTQIGRIVGVLQGARIRADRLAMDSELKNLQSEVRSGLRELDMVKGELAVAASSRGLVGRGLRSGTVGNGAGAVGVSSISAPVKSVAGASSTGTGLNMKSGIAGTGAGITSPVISGGDYLAAAREAEGTSQNNNNNNMAAAAISPELAPRSRSVAAVAEEEWEKQGIGFKSRAELGAFGSTPGMSGNSSSTPSQPFIGGSSILSDLLQQDLIHDQYDRTVREQDEALQNRMDHIKKKK